MFKKLFGKSTGSAERVVIVPKSDPGFRQRQAEFYVQLLRDPTVDPSQPIAFHEQLRGVTFDFSESSLDALDGVLLSVRSEIAGDYESLIATHPGLNLIVALGYYLGLSISYFGKLSMAWVGYEEARKLNPSLPERVDTDIGAMFGKTLTFPANVIAELLCNPLPERTCVAYARTLISGIPNADPQLLGLRKADELVSALHAQKITEEEALRLIVDLSLYLPVPVSISRKLPYAENWQSMLVMRNGEACSVALTNLNFADIWKRVSPEIKGGGIVPFSWIARTIPDEGVIGINVETDSEWIISREAISYCRGLIASRPAT